MVRWVGRSVGIRITVTENVFHNIKNIPHLSPKKPDEFPFMVYA